MKNISYLLSLLLAFSSVSFADEEVKEAPKESDEVVEEVTEESSDEEAEEDKEPTISAVSYTHLTLPTNHPV